MHQRDVDLPGEGKHVAGALDVGGQKGIAAAIVTDLGGAVHDARQRGLQP